MAFQIPSIYVLTVDMDRYIKWVSAQHSSYLGFADLASDGRPNSLSANYEGRGQLTRHHSAFSLFLGLLGAMLQTFWSDLGKIPIAKATCTCSSGLIHCVAYKKPVQIQT